MLSSIKDKLLNVTKKVPLLMNTTEDDPKSKRNVNLNAGADILNHYQDQWEDLHRNNENNAKLFSKAASQIDTISNKLEKDTVNLQAVHEVLGESNLLGQVTCCKDQIISLQKQIKHVDEELNELETLIDDVELANFKNERQFRLGLYKNQKDEELAKLQAQLEADFQKKMLIKNSEILKEREQVFHEAFKKDLETYKSLGTIPKIELPQTQTSALLEEIQLDYDKNELDQFLAEGDDQ